MRAPAAVVSACIALSALAAGCGGVSDKEPNLVAGKQAFVQKCGACHVLNRAGSKGVTGPNLDEAFHQAKADGFGDRSVQGVVEQQIRHPSRSGSMGTGVMPANLVTGDAVTDVAAYVALSTAKSGKDEGLLATAVKTTGPDKPAVEKDGTLKIGADPSGQLQYTSTKATATAGAISIEMDNASGVPHNIVIDGEGKTQTIPKGSSDFKATLAAGSYTYYCSVPGHREAGMVGKLTVK